MAKVLMRVAFNYVVPSGGIEVRLLDIEANVSTQAQQEGRAFREATAKLFEYGFVYNDGVGSLAVPPHQIITAWDIVEYDKVREPPEDEED